MDNEVGRHQHLSSLESRPILALTPCGHVVCQQCQGSRQFRQCPMYCGDVTGAMMMKLKSSAQARDCYTHTRLFRLQSQDLDKMRKAALKLSTDGSSQHGPKSAPGKEYHQHAVLGTVDWHHQSLFSPLSCHSSGMRSFYDGQAPSALNSVAGPCPSRIQVNRW